MLIWVTWSEWVKFYVFTTWPHCTTPEFHFGSPKRFHYVTSSWIKIATGTWSMYTVSFCFASLWLCLLRMLTSSNGNSFHVTGPLCVIHPSPVNSPNKGQWRGTLMFPLICAWINAWVNSRDAGDLTDRRTDRQTDRQTDGRTDGDAITLIEAWRHCIG